MNAVEKLQAAIEKLETLNAEDGELIVTLHRTIDAQIGMLRFSLSKYTDDGFEFFVNDPEIILADAILGGTE